MNNKYVTLTIEEYFNVVEKPSKKTQLVAKSLVKYLKLKKNTKAAA